MDFTLKTYRNFLQQFLHRSYGFYPLNKYLVNYNNPTSTHLTKKQTRNPSTRPFNHLTLNQIILRHDVDRLPENSLHTANLEHELGIKGTYYFRVVPESYDTVIMEKIARLGHEIGYHYEDVDLAIKNYELRITNYELQKNDLIDAAYESFCKNMEMLRKNFDIKTICMHGSPRSKFDNKLIWSKYDYRELGIIGEPYFDIDFSEVAYYTDTGRRWDGDSVSVRDKITWDKPEVARNEWPKFKKTVDMIKAIGKGRFPGKAMITVHPQRWTDNMALWTKELVWQNIKNVVKRVIVASQKYS